MLAKPNRYFMKNLLVLLVVLSFSACVIKDDSDIPVRKTASKPVAKEEAKDKDAKSASSDKDKSADKLPESKIFKNATLVRLEELNKALDEGVITKDEYKKMRKQVLNESGLR